MDKTNILNIVREVFIGLGFDAEQVILTASLKKHFDLDSLYYIELIMSLEDEFGIVIEEDDMHACRTVEDVVNMVHVKLSASRDVGI